MALARSPFFTTGRTAVSADNRDRRSRFRNATNVTIDALAVARLTRLATEDRIPVGWVRDRILERADRDSGGLGSASKLAELVSCPWCMSIWLAAGVVVVRRYRWWRPVALALAFSEVAGLAATWVER